MIMLSAILFGAGVACALAGENLLAIGLLVACLITTVIAKKIEEKHGFYR
jgi:hypothetical protein